MELLEFKKIVWDRALMLPKDIKRDQAFIVADSLIEAIEKAKASIDLATMGTSRREVIEILENFQKTEETEKWSINYLAIEITKHSLILSRVYGSQKAERILVVDVGAFITIPIPKRSYNNFFSFF